MIDWLKNRLPTRTSIQHNRWLRWLGPSLYHPRLWHMSRKGLSLGLAIGIFFGLLIPVAQIPFSAAAAVLLRANLPVAIGSTLVTNPVTFGPVYYAAYKVGVMVVGGAPAPVANAAEVLAQAPDPVAQETRSLRQQFIRFWAYLQGVGKPLVVGLALFAVIGGLLVYVLSSLIWIARTRWRRRQRLKTAQQRKASPDQP
jgi:hypothetical protein